MRLFGDLCFNWTSKINAILFGCVELSLCGLILKKPLWRAMKSSESVFVWIAISVLCLGTFVAYVYVILKNKFRFLVLPSLIQSFVFLLWAIFAFILMAYLSIDTTRCCGYSVRFTFPDVFSLSVFGICTGLYMSNIKIKYSIYKRMNSNSQPEQQQSHQTSESNPIII